MALARGLRRSVHQAAWHVCRPSTPFLCVAASVEIDPVFVADACCGRLHEKCCVAHAVEIHKPSQEEVCDTIIIYDRKTTKMRYCEYSYGVNCVCFLPALFFYASIVVDSVNKFVKKTTQNWLSETT